MLARVAIGEGFHFVTTAQGKHDHRCFIPGISYFGTMASFTRSTVFIAFLLAVHLATNTHYAPTGIVEGTFVPLLPSIEAVMARPQNVQTLMAAAQTHTCITNFNQSALSYLRDVTRGGKGLPHVVEVRGCHARLRRYLAHKFHQRPSEA